MTTAWTVTSQSGQILTGELDNGMVIMSSAKGNHGSVTLIVWQAKIVEMAKAGYTIVEA